MEYAKEPVFKVVGWRYGIVYKSYSLVHTHPNCLAYQLNHLTRAVEKSAGIFVFETYQDAEDYKNTIGLPFLYVLECKYSGEKVQINYVVKEKSKLNFKNEETALATLISGQQLLKDRTLMTIPEEPPSFVVPMVMAIRQVLPTGLLLR
jgi:hypothetical protein